MFVINVFRAQRRKSFSYNIYAFTESKPHDVPFWKGVCTQFLRKFRTKWACFYCFTVHVMNVYDINSYLYWTVLKNINGMKWRCPIFEQHRAFISWFIFKTSQTIYRLCKIRIWAQTSSNPAKKSTKI